MLLDDPKMTNSSTNILIKPINFSENEIEAIKQQLSQLEWCAFLESAETTHVDSNWSIFTAQPIITMQQDNQHTVIDYKLESTQQKQTGDPLKIQEQLRKHYFYAEACTDFPFTGGVIAAYDYEMGELYESIDKSLDSENSNKQSYACALYDWAILYHLPKQQYYLMQHKSIQSQQTASSLWSKRLTWLQSLTKNCQKESDTFCLTEPWQKDYNKAQYADAFLRIQEYILSGDCYQINFAQRLHASYQGDEYLAYCALRDSNKPPFAAFIRLAHKVIISVSPERLLQVKASKIQTKPIKGTMPRSLNKEVDANNRKQLKDSIKDQAENLMIVDLLRNDIGKVSKIGSVEVPKLFDIESFPAVHHLVSTVTAELDPQYSSEDLLRACFPGGSITGAPKIRAMQLIKELELFKRDIYCGSIAYINGNGDMDSSITIRTLTCKNGIIYCWGGGGIVADSIMENEYQECFDKLSKILPTLESM